MTPISWTALERRELAEFFKTGIDLGARQSAEALHAKLLAAETPHDGTVDHGSAQIAAADMAGFEIEPLLRQIADEASRETVPRARGVAHIFQQAPAHDEIRITAEQHRAVLPSLDHHSVGAEVEDRIGS